ncbi:MAG TPA: hypothetical protein DD640_08845 [Clostridiales bacterium]|nr:hypothetical protein [Clostridiales bacterium]
MPGFKKLKKGTVSDLLIFVFCTVLVMAPMAVLGIRQLADWVQIRQAEQFLERVILTAYEGMDMDRLADGQPSLDQRTAEQIIRRHFSDWLPDGLVNKLMLVSVNLQNRPITPAAHHWMGSSQPKYKPIITLSARFIDYQGRKIHLSQAIELILD